MSATLTSNQLIALLAIYRGTFENELPVGTRNRDLQVLGQRDLIVRSLGTSRSSSTYHATEKGKQLVNSLLSVAGAIASVPGVASVSLSEGIIDVCIDRPGGLSVVEAGHHRQVGPLSGFSTMHTGGAFVVEPDDGKGLILSDVEGDKARVNGGSFFLVGDASVALSPKTEESADFGPVKLVDVDMTLLATEQEATDVATERAKSNVGGRYVVLKAVAMHEVAVPIKSTRL